MSVKVLFFASLSERLGIQEQTVQIDSAQPARALWQQVVGDATMPSNVLVAINKEYADVDALVSDGDELAFFPPVTGG